MTYYLLGIKFYTVKAMWLLPFRISPPAVHYYVRISKKKERNKILYLIFTHMPYTQTRTRINRLQPVLPLDASDKTLSYFRNATKHPMFLYFLFFVQSYLFATSFVHLFDLRSLTPGPITF